MEAINTTTKPKGKSSDPYGIQLLKNNPKTEKEAIMGLRKCCNDHPLGCKREAECVRLYDIKSENWRRAEPHSPEPKRHTLEEKYAGWLATLHIKSAVQSITDRIYYQSYY